MKLYDLDETDIVKSVKEHLSDKCSAVGNYELIDDKLARKYGLPVKICFAVNNNETTVITAYPLKVKRKELL